LSNADASAAARPAKNRPKREDKNPAKQAGFI
jgi:hypothetical protein